MANFIKPLIGEVKYGVHVFSNNPINVNLVSELIKSNTILYQVTATYDIKFQGVDSRWRFLTEKERDEEYNKILDKYGR